MRYDYKTLLHTHMFQVFDILLVFEKRTSLPQEDPFQNCYLSGVEAMKDEITTIEKAVAEF